MQKRNAWGLYQSISRGFVVAVPLSWTLTEVEERLEIHSSVDDAAVIVSSYSATAGASVDAVVQVQRFLQTVNAKDKVDVKRMVPRRAFAKYTDIDGAKWFVMVLTKGRRFLLATCNTDAGLSDDSFEVGCDAVESLRFRTLPREIRKWHFTKRSRTKRSR